MFASLSTGHPNFAPEAIESEASSSRGDLRREAQPRLLAGTPPWVLDLLRREPAVSALDVWTSTKPGGMKLSSAFQELRAWSDLAGWMARAKPDPVWRSFVDKWARFEQDVRAQLAPPRASAGAAGHRARPFDPASSTGMLPRHIFAMLLSLSKDTRAAAIKELIAEPAPTSAPGPIGGAAALPEPIAMSDAPCGRDLPRPVAVDAGLHDRLRGVARTLSHLEVLNASALDPEEVPRLSRDLLDQSHASLREAWRCQRRGDRDGANLNATRASALCGESLSARRARGAPSSSPTSPARTMTPGRPLDRPNCLDPREISYPPDLRRVSPAAGRSPRRDV